MRRHENVLSANTLEEEATYFSTNQYSYVKSMEIKLNLVTFQTLI